MELLLRLPMDSLGEVMSAGDDGDDDWKVILAVTDKSDLHH